MAHTDVTDDAASTRTALDEPTAGQSAPDEGDADDKDAAGRKKI